MVRTEQLECGVRAVAKAMGVDLVFCVHHRPSVDHFHLHGFAAGGYRRRRGNVPLATVYHFTHQNPMVCDGCHKRIDMRDLRCSAHAYEHCLYCSKWCAGRAESRDGNGVGGGFRAG